ncbi:MAG: ATP-binding cassette domain-containing protein [Burkholderiaceae bacterium]|nr:ATP-binding cassette domain-containing protein [Burkholderiaceae bacterium]
MITLRDVTLRRGAKVVLERTSLTVHAGEKVGLVGRNGAGKSSLFALLANRLHADKGDVEVPPRWRIGEVAQSMPETDDGATEFVLQGDDVLMRAQAKLVEAETAGDGHAIAEAHLALEEAGTFDARARAQALLLGLGFRVEQLDAPVNSFSGGWRMRLQLARALMAPSDALLLDEPTNHLDLDALVWLESWLVRYPGTLIVISHDREFLDAITKITLHVDQSRVERYTGNYSAFEAARAERIEQAQAAYAKQQDRIAHLQRFIDRFKAKATKAKQAQSRVKALARMEKLAPILTASDFQFEFREPVSLPNPMLNLRDVSCGYMTPPVTGYGDTPPEGALPGLGRPGARRADAVILRHVTRTVMAGQRIGILGANGQGKSTLVKTITGVLDPLSGSMSVGKGLVIGYFAQQEMDLLHEDDTPLQMMTRLARKQVEAGGSDTREQDLRNFLGQFAFAGDMVHQHVGTLSGGERARLVLATIVWQRPNLLLLDEPTNHLDLTTREALSMALNEFEGSVMLVSHDRALLREVCDEFWLVVDGTVDELDADLDEYQRWLLEVSRARARGQEPPRRPGGEAPARPGAPRDATPASATPASASMSAATPPAGGSRRDERKQLAQSRAQLANRTRPLRMEIQQIDGRLEKLGAEKAELEAALVAGTVTASQMADTGRRLNHIAAETAMLEERWLELHAEIEAITAAG